MDLDLRQALRLVRRWWWLLLLAPLVVGAAATYYGRQADASRQPEYTASARILVTPPIDGVPDFQVDTFANLLQPVPEAVLQQVLQDLALSIDLDDLRSRVSGFAIEGTDLLVVTATYSDPQQAADIANAVVRRFSEYVAARASESSGAVRQTLDDQIAVAEDEVELAERRVEETEAEVEANAQRPTILANLQSELQSLTSDLDRRRQALAELMLQRHEQDRIQAGMSSLLTSAAAAELPSAPASGAVAFAPLIGAFVGLALAGGLILFLAYLDNTIGAGADFVSLTGAPLLSVIPRVARLRSGRRQLYVINRPNGPASEAVRLLRTNLEFAATAGEFRSLVVSSPGRGEGRSTVVANLAVAMAQAGFATVVIDADLRNPAQHRIFEAKNDRGLTTLLAQPNLEWRSVVVDVGIPNLLLVPSGPLPANPSDLLSLDRLPRLLAAMDRSTDLVLIDTPPVLSVSDPLVVAADADGVVLVCRSGRTRHDALRRAAAAFERGTVRIVGTVLNHRGARDEEEFAGSGGPQRPTRVVRAAPRALRHAPRRGGRPLSAHRPRAPRAEGYQAVHSSNGWTDDGRGQNAALWPKPTTIREGDGSPGA